MKKISLNEISFSTDTPEEYNASLKVLYSKDIDFKIGKDEIVIKERLTVDEYAELIHEIEKAISVKQSTNKSATKTNKEPKKKFFYTLYSCRCLNYSDVEFTQTDVITKAIEAWEAYGRPNNPECASKDILCPFNDNGFLSFKTRSFNYEFEEDIDEYIDELNEVEAVESVDKSNLIAHPQEDMLMTGHLIIKTNIKFN